MPVTRRATIRGLGGLSAALMFATAPRMAVAASAYPAGQSGASATPVSVAGAWDLAFRASDGATSVDRILATFGAEGGFQAALTPGWRTAAGALRFHGGGHGSWTTNDDGVVQAGYTALTYDETGSCDGSRQVAIRIGIDSQAKLTGAYVSRVYDADGTLIDLVTGAVDGVVAGPPAATAAEAF